MFYVVNIEEGHSVLSGTERTGRLGSVKRTGNVKLMSHESLLLAQMQLMSSTYMNADLKVIISVTEDISTWSYRPR